MRLDALCVLAVDAGSGADEAAKDFAEVTLVDEAGAGAGFDDGHLRIAQKVLGLFDTLAKDVLVRALAYALLKGSGKVVEIGVGYFGEGGELQLISDIGLDVFEHLVEARG